MCPMCGCNVCNDMGALAGYHWVRCVACGTEYVINYPDDLFGAPEPDEEELELEDVDA